MAPNPSTQTAGTTNTNLTDAAQEVKSALGVWHDKSRREVVQIAKDKNFVRFSNDIERANADQNTPLDDKKIYQNIELRFAKKEAKQYLRKTKTDLLIDDAKERASGKDTGNFPKIITNFTTRLDTELQLGGEEKSVTKAAPKAA